MRFQFVEGTEILSEAEQRPVAVLWLDLCEDENIKPTSASKSTPYLKLDCVKIARGHGGLVHMREKGLTAVFGVPTALEDDVTRAIIAAEQMWQTVQHTVLNKSKFAISYSHVIINKNEEDSNDIAIEGEALDQAKFLTFITPPGKIWVTGPVQASTSYYCEYKPADITTKTAVSVWEFLNFRVEPEEHRGLTGVQTSLIGRETSLQAMNQLSQNLNRGVGGIIWIEGEAGIGKSRLMREFITAVAPDKAYVWSGGCSPQYVNHAFSLFTSILTNAFDLKSADSAEEIHQKIDDRFQRWPQAVHNIQSYLEILAGIQPTGENSEQLNQLQPEQLRQQTFVATRRLLKTIVKDRPIILVCDDLHWVDPISAELLLFIATMVATDPILFVCAQRRQGADAPNDRLVKLQSLLPGYTNRIFLEKLSTQNSQQLVNELLPEAELPHEFYDLTITRSSGNPYFIEEFVRMFIEQGHIQQDNGQWQINFEASQLKDLIPVSLDTLIHARIDALPADLRHVLQHASIIGSRFGTNLLQAITNLPNIPEILDRLSMRLMISATAVSDHWQFNHILFQTIVYNAIPKTKRQSLHLQVAEALQSGENQTERAKELAYHFSQAEQYEQAVPYLILAGESAASHYANEEAVEFFQQANTFLSQQQITDPEKQWRISTGLGDAYRNMGQYDDSIAALENMLPFAQNEPAFKDRHPDLLRRLGETYRKQGNFEEAEKYLQPARDLLGDPTDHDESIAATRILTELAWVYYSQGQFELARKNCDESLHFARQARSLNEEAKAENLFGGICYRLGDWQGALHHTTRAMVYREQIGSTWDVAKTYDNLGILAFAIGHWAKAVDYFQRNLALRLELGDVEGIAITHNNLAEAYLGQGKLTLAETHYREGLKTARLFNILFHITNNYLGLSQVLIRQKKYEEAETIIADGLIKARELDSQMMLAEMYRSQAELYLAQKNWEDALSVAKKAAKLAIDSGNRALEASSWRIASEASLKMGNLVLAQTMLNKAKTALEGVTDELEKGLIAAQSYQINQALGNEEDAAADYILAEKTFNHLGAIYYLEKLNK